MACWLECWCYEPKFYSTMIHLHLHSRSQEHKKAVTSVVENYWRQWKRYVVLWLAHTHTHMCVFCTCVWSFSNYVCHLQDVCSHKDRVLLLKIPWQLTVWIKLTTQESWTHGYTDGSAENAVRNGGAGVYIKYAGGKEDKISLATGLYSTNYKAEAEALKTAAAHIEASTHASLKVVLLTDALSVLQALQSNRDTEINDLSTALASLCRRHEVTLQWIPSHCNLPGNEAADSLAKEGTTKEQVDRSTSYPEVKTILKAKQHSKWRHKHPRYNKADPYYLLTRREQVTVFRLRTGHNRLNYHLYSKLRIGHTEQCPCGTGSQTTEHLLQFCPTYEPLRKGIWPDHTPLARKLYGSLRDLRCTATFIGETGISIWRMRRRRLFELVLVTFALTKC